MLLDWAFLIVGAIGFGAGWMSRWQYDRKNWEPDNEDWSDVYDRWDRS